MKHPRQAGEVFFADYYYHFPYGLAQAAHEAGKYSRKQQRAPVHAVHDKPARKEQ